MTDRRDFLRRLAALAGAAGVADGRISTQHGQQRPAPPSDRSRPAQPVSSRPASTRR